MAITAINIVQDNIYGSSNLLPAHSPLIFLADATFTGTAPDTLGVLFAAGETASEVISYYKAIYYNDQSATARRFAFIANDAMREYMPAVFERYQLSETLIDQQYTYQIAVQFYDLDTPETKDTSTFIAIHSAKQFGQVPNMSDVYSNSDRTFFCKKGSHIYVYFYDIGTYASVNITDGGVNKGAFSFIGSNENGLYRYKTVATADKTVIIDDGTNPATTHTIKVIDDCEDGIELKYVDRNGMIRFFPFNKFYEISDTPERIGKTQKFLTSIESDGTNAENVGYRTERKYLLTATNVTNEQLEVLSDIYSSLKVWMRINESIDNATAWIEVDVSGDGISKRRKYFGGSVDVEVTLPEIYNITRL